MIQGSFCPILDPSLYAKMVFHTFDDDGNGRISFSVIFPQKSVAWNSAIKIW